MKRLTPEDFLKRFAMPDDTDFHSEINDALWTNNVLKYMQAYAEHCEESAWVTDGSLPPVDQDSPLTSIWVFTINVDGEIRSNFYHFGQSVLFRGHWHFDKDSVCAWRSLPTPPKK